MYTMAPLVYLTHSILGTHPLTPLSVPPPTHQLLKKSPEERLGAGPEDGEAVKRHNFFGTVDWDLVNSRGMKPPFVPNVVSQTRCQINS